MRLGILLGFVIGGLIAVLLKQSDGKVHGPIGAVKRQIHEATEAAKEEATQKEAELLAQYEAARRGEKPSDAKA
jgi:hypothetical protein